MYLGLGFKVEDLGPFGYIIYTGAPKGDSDFGDYQPYIRQPFFVPEQKALK